MAPNLGFVLTDASGEPVSRTYQYRKVMKPMLERKRRARINRCLDELKELMTGALQTEGENVAKLEKADILELTVRHLHNVRRQTQIATRGTEQTYADRFRAGFRHCAAEVSHFLGNLDQSTNGHVIQHLNNCIKHLETVVQTQQQQQQQQPNQPVPIPYNHQQRLSVQISAPKPSTKAGIWINKDGETIVMPIKNHQNFEMVPRNYPGHFDEQIHLTRICTPPMSPNIDIDEPPVWRPW